MRTILLRLMQQSATAKLSSGSSSSAGFREKMDDVCCEMNAEHVTELANDSTIAGTNVQCPPLLPTSQRGK